MPDQTDQLGILDIRRLPDPEFDELWTSLILPAEDKDRLLAQAVLNFTARAMLQEATLPLHGVILLVGPPGTGKTSLGRGLASRTAASVQNEFKYLEVEPHALASASLGRSQQAVRELLGTVIAEHALDHPCIVLLDEVETLAADRTRMSLQANPVDVHRATDAVLAQLDHLARTSPNILFIATSNFPAAIDEAFISRTDLVLTIDLPNAEACRRIVIDTVERLASVYPKLKALCQHKLLDRAAERSVGLDGRRIRKAVVSALAHSKEIAIDPSRLSAEAILSAIDQAQLEKARREKIR